MKSLIEYAITHQLVEGLMWKGIDDILHFEDALCVYN